MHSNDDLESGEPLDFASATPHAKQAVGAVSSSIEASASGTIAIHRYDELLAALTERAERERDPDLIVRLRPVLIALGRSIDRARVAIHHIHRARVTGQGEDEATDQLETRLREMENAGHRAVRLMTDSDSKAIFADGPTSSALVSSTND